MNLALIEEFLIYSLLINYTILIVWFCAFSFAHEFIYRLHSRWFHFAKESFDAIHYVGMAAFKIGIFLLNLAPLLAILAMR